MKKVSEAFSWTPPLAWDEKRRGVNLVYRLPERELVISFWAIKDGLKPEKQAAALQALMETALKAIEKDSKNPNLQPSVPLTRVDENNLEFWVQSLATKDGTVGISTAAVKGISGVMLATMEAPTRPDHFPVFVEFLRSVKTLAVVALLFLAASVSMAAPADTVMPVSVYRKYIWAAREAYEHRDFARAESLLTSYEKLGSPGDPLLEAAGCDPALGVRLLSAALESNRACAKRQSNNAHWTADQIEQAQSAVVHALQAGDSASLALFLECAPLDVTGRASFCHTPHYPTAADLQQFVSQVKLNPDVIQKFEWRDVRISWDAPNKSTPSPQDFQEQGFTAIDDSGLKWILYSSSALWRPCGMSGVPLLTLRQDKSGNVRIAGFAASCLETTAQGTRK